MGDMASDNIATELVYVQLRIFLFISLVIVMSGGM